MLKRDFFIKAMNSELFRRKEWLFLAFSLVSESPDHHKANPYPYRIIQTPTGYFFTDPEDLTKTIFIEDGKVGEPLFNIHDTLAISAEDNVKNCTSTIETTYGRLLLNYAFFIYPFGDTIPYQNKKIDPRGAEGLILERLEDDPANESEKKPGVIYVCDYLKFCEAVFYLSGISLLVIPTITAKAITAAPGMVAYKNKLLEENKDRLHDPAVIAKIDALLVQYDKEYLKGDDAVNFFIGSKATEIVRKKLFDMHGAEAGFSAGVEVNPIRNSLSEGWDIDRLPDMVNSSRVGTYARGAETMLGGESVKWLLRSSSNMSITNDDCGGKLGMPVLVADDNYKTLIGFHIFDNGNEVHIPNAEVAKSYVGKEIMRRSPMYCKSTMTDYCKKCCGPRLTVLPTALSSAVTDYGSIMMYISMKAMKGKALQTRKLNVMASIF